MRAALRYSAPATESPTKDIPITDLPRIDPAIRTVLDPDETVHAQAEAVDAILAVPTGDSSWSTPSASR